MTDVSREAVEELAKICDQDAQYMTDRYGFPKGKLALSPVGETLRALRDALDEAWAENITLREELYRAAFENYELTDHIQGSREKFEYLKSLTLPYKPQEDVTDG